MVFDVLSLQAASSLVILVSAVIYLLDTLMLRDALPGRLWATAFLAGVFSAVCYLVSIAVPGAFVAIALGNGAFVGATSFIWLGSAAFNGRRLRVPVIVTSVGLVVVVLLALLDLSLIHI